MTDQLTQDQQLAALGRYEYGWADPDTAGASAHTPMPVTSDLTARFCTDCARSASQAMRC